MATERRDVRRRLEQYLSNPDCGANTISAVHGVPMAEVAKQLGLPAKFGQSSLAVARGQQFERSLFEHQAQPLIAALQKEGALVTGPCSWVDMRLQKSGGPSDSLLQAEQSFAALLQSWATGSSAHALPCLIASATVSLPSGTFLPDGAFAIDALIAHAPAGEGPIELEVGEIKVYPDRGGHTDSVQLATARAQAGLYVHVLDRYLDALGLSGKFRVRRHGFLVLSKGGSNFPRVRAREELAYQAARAARALPRLAQASRATAELANESDAGTRVVAVTSAPTCYGERCVPFCALATHCQRQALAQGDAAALGDDVARLCGPIGLGRAVELLDGDSPANGVESDFVRRLDEAVPGSKR